MATTTVTSSNNVSLFWTGFNTNEVWHDMVIIDAFIAATTIFFACAHVATITWFLLTYASDTLINLYPFHRRRQVITVRSRRGAGDRLDYAEIDRHGRASSTSSTSPTSPTSPTSRMLFAPLPLRSYVVRPLLFILKTR